MGGILLRCVYRRYKDSALTAKYWCCFLSKMARKNERWFVRFCRHLRDSFGRERTLLPWREMDLSPLLACCEWEEKTDFYDVYWSINVHFFLKKKDPFDLIPNVLWQSKFFTCQTVGAVPALASGRPLKSPHVCLLWAGNWSQSGRPGQNEEGARNTFLCGDRPFTQQDAVNWVSVCY